MDTKGMFGIIGSGVVIYRALFPIRVWYYSVSLIETGYSWIAILIAVFAAISLPLALFESKLLWITTILSTGAIALLYVLTSEDYVYIADTVWITFIVGNIMQYIGSAMPER